MGAVGVLADEDRAALERYLRAEGVDDDVRARIMSLAASGLSWSPSEAPGRCRLGGAGLLPPGTEWPCDRNGRPLSFLAAICLEELPAWSPLPHMGWLLFFAVLRSDRREELPVLEIAANEAGAPIRVLFSDTVEEADAPPGAVVLTRRAVELCSAPTVPDDYEAPERVGLEEEDYQELAAGLRYGSEGWSLGRGAHWTFGAWSDPAFGQPPPGSLLLLHLAHDDDLGLDLGGGTLEFRIDADDALHGDWIQVEVQPGFD